MAYTIAQFLTLCMSNMLPSRRDPTQVRGADSMMLYSAVNSVMDEWFTSAAPQYTINSTSQELFAPVQVMVNVTQNSKTFTYTSGIPAVGYATSAATIGQAIIIAGDDQVLNRVQQDGQLWRAYLGATGQMAATIYCDTAVFNSTDFKVVGPVRWTGYGYTYATDLEELTSSNPWMYPAIPEFPVIGYYGRPFAYITDVHNPVVGTDAPYWYLRVWPLPAGSGNVSYKVQSMPPCFSSADLATQRKIPVPDQFASLLSELVQEHLILSSNWDPAKDKGAALRQAVSARAKLTGDIQNRRTRSAGDRVGTPRGF